MKGAHFFRLGLTMALATVACQGWSYDKDVHFNLTYVMGRVNGLSPSESLEVASGDQGMDDNDSVVASLDVPQNHMWHSLEPSQQAATDRMNFLWSRAVASKSLVKLGQFLHFAQDYFSHRDFHAAPPLSAGWKPYGPVLGHGLDGHNPDCVAFDPARAKAMAHLSMEKIREFSATVLHKTPPTRGVACIDPVVDALAAIYTKSGSTYNVPKADSGVSDALEKSVRAQIKASQLEIPVDASAPGAVPYQSITPYKFDLMAEMASADRPMKHYKVSVKTGDLANAGTDANIFVTLFGTKGSTVEYNLKPWYELKGNAFERGHTDSFTLTQLIRKTANQADVSMAAPLIKGGPYTIEFKDIVDLGEIKQVHVRSDNFGLAPGWFLEYLDVSDGGPAKRFDCHQWIESPNLAVTLDDTPLMDYVVRVKTGDKLGAGTDANVYLIMYGSNGTSKEYHLDQMLHDAHGPLYNAFERNANEAVTIHMKSIGAVQKIQIRHDNSGIGPGWFLSYVDVDQGATHKRFNLNGWIEKPNLVKTIN